MTIISVLYSIILAPIVQIIEISYKLFSKVFDNSGIAVLGVSLTVTLLCLPLYIVAESWQEKERKIQKDLKPGVERIKNFFKGDEQYMILSTFYRQNHYHPIMALRSSFGILIQIPFFLAAYHTLSSLPDLQGESFLFIRNMGAPDSIFKIGSFNINILPIAMTLINCISGAIYSKGHGIREKIQIYGMAAVFLVILYKSPAGLVLYWTMNNIFSLVKNIFYKMKNPLKVLYLIMCLFIVLASVYIMFFYTGGADAKKRLAACSALLALILIPLYIKGINWLLFNPQKNLIADKKLRLSIFIFSAFSLCVFTGLVLPSSLILSSVQEFSNIDSYTNPAGFLQNSFWLSFGLIIFWPACIYFLFREKVQASFCFLYIFLLVCAVLNAYVFAGNYGTMDSTLKFIDGFQNQPAFFTLSNIAVCIAVFILLNFVFKLKGGKILSNLCLISLAAFVVFSAANISGVSKQYKEFSKISGPDKNDGFSPKYHLSRNHKNVMIFMLDRFESAYFPYILKDEPGLKEKLDGFTYYPNTISANGHTLMGSPGVYGGYDYTPYEMNKRSGELLKDKHNEALLLLPKILSEEKGFEAYISDLSWANYSYISDMTFAENLPDIHPFSVMGRYSSDFKKECMKSGFEKNSLSAGINRNLFWASLFRESPVILREIIYYKGTWWENGAKENSTAFADWYSALYFLPKITRIDSEKPTLTIITNESCHSSEDISMYSFDTQKDVTNLKGLSLNANWSYPIDIVTLNTVGNFIEYLKEENIFDNTKIIIASDHGIGLNIFNNIYDKATIDGYLKDHLNCILLVKDFNSRGGIKTDMTFMTNADVPNIALKDIVENPVNPFTKNEIYDGYKKKNGIFVTTANLFMPYHSRSKYAFTVSPDSWYNVKDNIFIDKNWKKIN